MKKSYLKQVFCFNKTSAIHNEFVCPTLGVCSHKKYFPFSFGDTTNAIHHCLNHVPYYFSWGNP
jgi:hypothetical protein